MFITCQLDSKLISLTSMGIKVSMPNKIRGLSDLKFEDNELETVILQRRSIRTINSIEVGDTIKEKDFQFQRPCPNDAISINDFKLIIGKKLTT